MVSNGSHSAKVNANTNILVYVFHTLKSYFSIESSMHLLEIPSCVKNLCHVISLMPNDVITHGYLVIFLSIETYASEYLIFQKGNIKIKHPGMVIKYITKLA